VSYFLQQVVSSECAEVSNINGELEPADSLTALHSGANEADMATRGYADNASANPKEKSVYM